ncbi:MAG: hypothetical protein LUG95_00725 [Clostridiales bacterium]|nr:hypothetical protein [Clostridiales bacterium]
MPNCGAVGVNEELEAAENIASSPVPDNNKKVAVITSVILIGVISVAIIGGIISASLSSGSSSDTADKVRAAYNNEIIPDVGVLDTADPSNCNEGTVSALFEDMDNDSTDEFITAYYSADDDDSAIDFNLSFCTYEDGEVDNANTVTMYSENDYTQDDVEHLTNSTILYTFEYQSVTYIACEHIDQVDVYDYECHIYAFSGGEFYEVGNIFVPNNAIGTGGEPIIAYSTVLPDTAYDIDNSDFDFNEIKNFEIADDAKILYFESRYDESAYDEYFESEYETVEYFFSLFGIEKDEFYNLDDSVYSLVYNSDYDLLYTYSFERDYSTENGGKYEIVDYTDFASLVESDEDDTEDIETETLTPTQEDYDNFIDMINCMYHVSSGNSDISELSVEVITREYLMSPVGYWGGIYEYFYGEVEAKLEPSKEITDVLQTESQEDSEYTITYIKLDTDKADWIIENVYNKEPDRESDNYGYGYIDDSLYILFEDGGGGSPTFSFEEAYSLGNNQYGIVAFSRFDDDNEEYRIYDHNAYYLVTLCEDDEMDRYWSIQEFSDGEPCFDIPDDETTTAKTTTADESQAMYDAYKKKFNEEYDDLLAECEGNENMMPVSNPAYTLYDLDNNGVQELIVETGTYEADSMFHIYTYDGGIEKLGECGVSHSGLYSSDNADGLYRFSCHMGYESIYKLTLEDGELNKEELYNSGKEEVYDYDAWSQERVGETQYVE